MSEQIVFKAGNSNVVAIPKSMANKYGLKSGSKVSIEELPDQKAILIKKYSKLKKKFSSSNLTPEFRKWLQQVLKEDGGVLDELAER